MHRCHMSSRAIVHPLLLAFSRDVGLPAPSKLNMRLRKLHLSDFPVASIAPLWVVVPRRDASRVLLGLGGGVCSQSLLSCLALASRMDYSPPGSSPGNFPGKNTGVVCHFLLQGIFLAQGMNPGLPRLLHCRWILYH